MSSSESQDPDSHGDPKPRRVFRRDEQPRFNSFKEAVKWCLKYPYGQQTSHLIAIILSDPNLNFREFLKDKEIWELRGQMERLFPSSHDVIRDEEKKRREKEEEEKRKKEEEEQKMKKDTG